MTLKRRRSFSSLSSSALKSKKPKTHTPPTPNRPDRLSSLSDELLIRILHLLPVECVLLCQSLNHKFRRLASDTQVWKGLYYTRFVLPRALRLPRTLPSDFEDGRKWQGRGLPEFSSRRSKWLDEGRLLGGSEGRGVDGRGAKETDWKARYKLRHNWSIGAAEVREIGLDLGARSEDEDEVHDIGGDGFSTERTLMARLVDGVVVTVDAREGLRAWDLKRRECVARFPLTGCDGYGSGAMPTCLGVNSESGAGEGIGVVVGFQDGGFGLWKLWIGGNGAEGRFETQYWSAVTETRNSDVDHDMELSAVAYANPYLLTITEHQVLSLYVFDGETAVRREDIGTTKEPSTVEEEDNGPETLHSNTQAEFEPRMANSKCTQPRLLTSLKSHTSWPPLSLSIRSTPHSIIASIAYALPTYLSSWSVGLQELHLTPTGSISRSRLASAVEQGFQSLLSSSSAPASPSSSRSPRSASSKGTGGRAGAHYGNGRPTSLSYSHPYLLAGNRDNTLSLYLVTSNNHELKISKSTTLWGHTSSISGAQVGGRGKAVSVSARGEELRVWELEGGLGKGGKVIGLGERSVRVRGEGSEYSKATKGGECIERGESSGPSGRRAGGTELQKRHWVGFDDEVVIVLKQSGMGPLSTRALLVYDFT